MDSQRDYTKYAPKNEFTWPLSAGVGLLLAVAATGLLWGLYQSRLQEVPVAFLVVTWLLYWLTFICGAGIDVRLSDSARGFAAYASIRLGFVAIAASALGGAIF